jgi:hypothetical protein
MSGFKVQRAGDSQQARGDHAGFQSNASPVLQKGDLLAEGVEDSQRHMRDRDCGVVWRLSAFLHTFEEILLLNVIFRFFAQLTIIRNQPNK